MIDLALSLEAGNLAIANVVTSGPGQATIRIDPKVGWDAAGIRKLSMLLAGVATILEAQGGE